MKYFNWDKFCICDLHMHVPELLERRPDLLPRGRPGKILAAASSPPLPTHLTAAGGTGCQSLPSGRRLQAHLLALQELSRQERCGGLGWRARQWRSETGAVTPGHLGGGHAVMAAMTARRMVVASMKVAVICARDFSFPDSRAAAATHLSVSLYVDDLRIIFLLAT